MGDETHKGDGMAWRRGDPRICPSVYGRERGRAWEGTDWWLDPNKSVDHGRGHTDEVYSPEVQRVLREMEELSASPSLDMSGTTRNYNELTEWEIDDMSARVHEPHCPVVNRTDCHWSALMSVEECTDWCNRGWTLSCSLEARCLQMKWN